MRICGRNSKLCLGLIKTIWKGLVWFTHNAHMKWLTVDSTEFHALSTWTMPSDSPLRVGKNEFYRQLVSSLALDSFVRLKAIGFLFKEISCDIFLQKKAENDR